MVSVEGFEPPTSCSQSTRSSQTELHQDASARLQHPGSPMRRLSLSRSGTENDLAECQRFER